MRRCLRNRKSTFPGLIYTKYKQHQYFTGPNIAIGKPTDQYPGVLDNGTPEKAVDGVKGNSWNATDCAHTQQGNMTDRAWWTVDLGDEYRVTGIKIFNRDKKRKFEDDYSLLLFNVIAIVACFESHR